MYLCSKIVSPILTLAIFFLLRYHARTCNVKLSFLTLWQFSFRLNTHMIPICKESELCPVPLHIFNRNYAFYGTYIRFRS